MSDDSTLSPKADESDAPLTVDEALKVVPRLTASKAIASGIISTAIAFLTPLKFAMENGITGAEWVDIVTFTIIGAAAGFGVPYVVPARAK